jgi:N-acetylglucosamine-6-phosphate deacetylase
VIALDTAVRNLVRSGAASLPAAVAAASRNPLAMLGVTDRGGLAVVSTFRAGRRVPA